MCEECVSDLLRSLKAGSWSDRVVLDEGFEVGLHADVCYLPMVAHERRKPRCARHEVDVQLVVAELCPPELYGILGLVATTGERCHWHAHQVVASDRTDNRLVQQPPAMTLTTDEQLTSRPLHTVGRKHVATWKQHVLAEVAVAARGRVNRNTYPVFSVLLGASDPPPYQIAYARSAAAAEGHNGDVSFMSNTRIAYVFLRALNVKNMNNTC